MKSTFPAAPTSVRRSIRLALRVTPEQRLLLRLAAEATGKALSDFILESACQAAEETLIDQRLFVASNDQAQSLLDLLERPADDDAGLRDLFSRCEPWQRR